MKKITLLLLAFLMLFSLFSCKKESVLSEYKIYLPSDEAQSWEKQSAYALQSAIRKAYGITLEIVINPNLRSSKEILVGRESLSEEHQALFDYQSVGYDGFGIACDGEKYILSAVTETGLSAAIDHFVTSVITEDLTLKENYSYMQKASVATNTQGAKLNVEMSDNRGVDVYKVHESAPAGYRYGPSIIVNDDGSMDMWLAGGGSGFEQWDWIVYMHSEDGESWSEEKCVLQPTPNSLDHYSCCDPGVIYVNGYYYLGYTSTLNNNQCDNNLFVARSKNPDGPFEKWNGSGWGGNEPKPLVYFAEDQALWGIGEVSFVELNGKLFIYYTEKGSEGNVTRVATADANDENWPLTLEHHGIAIPNHTHDAVDVKYVDSYGKFLAVASDERLSEDSYLIFLDSHDGLSFEAVDACKESIFFFCHNPGISGSPNGHIRAMDKTYVAYAYGRDWGIWNVRLQQISISISENADFSEINKTNVRSEISRDTRDVGLLQTVGISSLDQCVIRVPLNQQYAILTLAKCNITHTEWKNLKDYKDQVKLYGYDENIATQVESGNLTMKLHGVGETMITAEYDGHLTYIYLIVYEDDISSDTVVSVEPVAYDTINMNTEGSFQPQIKSIVTYADGSWEMVWSQLEHGVSYEYDSSALEINENSYILPKKAGSHTVKIKVGDKVGTLTVNVTVPDYTTLDFTDPETGTVMLRQTNNCEAQLCDKGLMLTSTNGIDPFITVNYIDGCLKAEDFSSLTVKYIIPKENKRTDYNSQTFLRCGADAVLEEKISQRSPLVKNGELQTLTLDLQGKEYWKGDITEIRFDFFDECNTGDVIYIESITLNK